MADYPRVLAIDFDGTICQHEYPGIGKPKAGVREALTQFQELGYHVMIYTCRTCKWYAEVFNPENEPLDMNRQCVREMIAWLKLHRIPYDSIDDGTKGKPFAEAYIDDKAIRFENNWPLIAHAIAYGELAR